MSSRSIYRIRLIPLLVTLFVFILAPSLSAWANSNTVPFGDKISRNIVNYNRTTPHLATSGLILDGGIQELKSQGFKLIIDLRTPPEGTAIEEAAATEAGLQYVNIPISRGAPTKSQIQKLTGLIENPANYPVLLHCVSGNRAGTLWTLYQISKGVPTEIAIEMGRTVGMRFSREKQVRALLAQ